MAVALEVEPRTNFPFALADMVTVIFPDLTFAFSEVSPQMAGSNDLVNLNEI